MNPKQTRDRVAQLTDSFEQYPTESRIAQVILFHLSTLSGFGNLLDELQPGVHRETQQSIEGIIKLELGSTSMKPHEFDATEVEVYHTADQEVHKVGDNVAVVWNINETSTTLTDGGVSVTTTTRNRVSKPYIDFLWVRFDKDGEAYLDEDGPVDGGIDAKFAEEICRELKDAIAYLKSLESSPEQSLG